MIYSLWLVKQNEINKQLTQILFRSNSIDRAVLHLDMLHLILSSKVCIYLQTHIFTLLAIFLTLFRGSLTLILGLGRRSLDLASLVENQESVRRVN